MSLAQKLPSRHVEPPCNKVGILKLRLEFDEFQICFSSLRSIVKVSVFDSLTYICFMYPKILSPLRYPLKKEQK